MRARSYLVVDDNAAFAENLAEILVDAGGEVAVAPGGPGALELASARRFDVLITDMRMPAMNGAVLVHQIRQVDPGLPALVVTAYTGEDDLLAARQEGLLAVLPKPAPIERLLELLSVARRDGLVALIEDDAALCDNLCEALRDHGFSAVTAASVTETDRLGEVKPFAALVDLRVPGGPDGEAMRRLSHRFPGLPMFVITAHPQSAPGPEVFIKPFDTGKLLAALVRIHGARR
jgi:CheY-like chemotaxis protein